MGLNLKLLPIECDRPELRYSHTVLQAARAADIESELEHRGIRAIRLPSALSCFLAYGDNGEHAYGDITEDAFGKPLTCVSVGELMQLAFEPFVTAVQQNRATWSYLGELPTEMRVALYWKG